MSLCALRVQSQRIHKSSSRLKFSCSELFKTALEMFKGRALTPHAATMMGMYGYEFARARRVHSQRIHKSSSRLQFSCSDVFKTALKLFRGRALTPHARATRIGMYRYGSVHAPRPKSTDSQIVESAEILVF